MKKQHILVVDDEKNMLITLEYILEVNNYKVTLANNAYDALKLLVHYIQTGEQVDLLITDVQMSGMNGFDLIEAIKNLRIFLPVVIITTFGRKEYPHILTPVSYYEYLEKPFDDMELLKRVSNLLTPQVMVHHQQ